MEKVYVDKNNQALIICPKCGFEKNVDAVNFRNTNDIVTGECKCKETYKFALEYRQHHRKRVKLPCEYIIPKSGEKGEAIIWELSLTGIRFESIRPHQISTDDILEVSFKLDNSSRKEIRKIVKVIWVDDRLVGVQYTERELYNKDLAFYLNF